MTTIEINIPGDPVGKERARSAYLRNRTVHYTPKKTRAWQYTAQIFARQAFGSGEPLTCPISLDIMIVLEIPASWPEWKRRAAVIGQIEPTVKPDDDNVEKAVKDAFTGIIWRDDCQVVHCTNRKLYGLKPTVFVLVHPRGTYPAQIKERPAEVAK